MGTNGLLPPEIIEEILLWHPAKSLGRFRCVSKRWQVLISSPRFIKTHLNRSSNHHYHHKLILSSPQQSLYSVDLSALGKLDIVEATELRFSLPLDQWEDFNCMCCNGMILAGDNHSVFLVNPTTREFLKVWETLDEDGSKDDVYIIISGFGYDSLMDDYKIVVIEQDDTQNEEEVHFLGRFLWVYSIRCKRWRRTHLPQINRWRRGKIDHAECTSKLGVYVKGCLHWLFNRVSDSSWFIVSFSLHDEEFKEVGSPNFLNDENADVAAHHELVVVSGYLCFLVCWNDDLTDVWVMEDYGVQESWKKISIYGLGTSMVVPLFLSKDREVVLEVNGGYIAVYKVAEKTLRYVEISGIPCEFEVSGIYIESLVSPMYGNELRHLQGE